MSKRRQIVKVLLILMIGYFCVVLGNSLFELYQARGRVSEAREMLAEAKRENDDLKARFGVVNSDEFKEKEVREKLNRQLPGETVVIVPKRDYGQEQEDDGDTRELANWEKWLALFR